MKKGKVTGGLKKLHIEKVSALYSTPKIIRLIKSISVSWAGECSCAWERTEMPTNFLVGKR
jgi:hypothetical protein